MPPIFTVIADIPGRLPRATAGRVVEPLGSMIAAKIIEQRRAYEHAGDACGLVDAR
jgi:hypothetical protein